MKFNLSLTVAYILYFSSTFQMEHIKNSQKNSVYNHRYSKTKNSEYTKNRLLRSYLTNN